MITAERLRELLDYDPETGIFTWRVSSRNYRVGDKAGSQRKNGRWLICVEHEKRMRSVWAFFWMTGQLPTQHIDHINRDPSDDRWANLRHCNRFENLHNMGLRKDNTSGYIGVHKRTNGRYLAYTRTNEGKRIYLGHHPTAEEAARVRDAEAIKLYGEFAVLNFP